MENLIEQNMGLVLTIVNRFNPKTHHDKEAYIQAGRIGLWKALSKFSQAKGSKFSPYAWNPIKWEIIKEIRTASARHNNVSQLDDQYEPECDYTQPFWEWIPNTLTTCEHDIIELRLAGYNFKEISSQLQLSRSNIKKNYNSAIKKIKELNYE
tara:strand:+ start:4402 stop:4860 length:459 start_codon:yes stop_codon:yes gene_type:complete